VSIYNVGSAYAGSGADGRGDSPFGSGGSGADTDIDTDAIIASRFARRSKPDKTATCGLLLNTLLYVFSRFMSSV
jgi:hypothetical protein